MKSTAGAVRGDGWLTAGSVASRRGTMRSMARAAPDDDPTAGPPPPTRTPGERRLARPPSRPLRTDRAPATTRRPAARAARARGSSRSGRVRRRLADRRARRHHVARRARSRSAPGWSSSRSSPAGSSGWRQGRGRRRDRRSDPRGRGAPRHDRLVRARPGGDVALRAERGRRPAARSTTCETFGPVVPLVRRASLGGVVERPLTARDRSRSGTPTEADHAALARLVDEWWGERRAARSCRACGSATSRRPGVGRGRDGRRSGFPSRSRARTDRRGRAPAGGRRPTGGGGASAGARERFAEDGPTRGATRVAAVWPGNRVGVRFLRRWASGRSTASGTPRAVRGAGDRRLRRRGRGPGVFELSCHPTDRELREHAAGRQLLVQQARERAPAGRRAARRRASGEELLALGVDEDVRPPERMLDELSRFSARSGPSARRRRGTAATSSCDRAVDVAHERGVHADSPMRRARGVAAISAARRPSAGRRVVARPTASPARAQLGQQPAARRRGDGEPVPEVGQALADQAFGRVDQEHRRFEAALALDEVRLLPGVLEVVAGVRLVRDDVR